MLWLMAGTALLVTLMLLARWFTAASPGDLAQAGRVFLAVFGAVAGTGLLAIGRFGLAIAVLIAMAVALRSLRKAGSGADPLDEGPAPGRSSSVETDLLAMRLDHATGELEGTVRTGPQAGRGLHELGLSALLELLELARREDPRSVPLLEAWLDRHQPGWRTASADAGRPGEAASGAMDEATALEILGLEPGAGDEEVKAAHRRLMARLHPDHGGSGFLASQINRARDFLLQHHA
ncbi:hypothetical protein SH611_09065 [Geminicoccaceae bacterium 1502E]|nr:hypothetical protein [Geminicoccaceae bacterium 1502E]